MPALSPALKLRLDANELDEIRQDAALVAEARAALPAVRALLSAPAGQGGVSAVIGRRFITYPQPQRSEAQWAAWWADYFDALADVPRVALEAAMVAWVKTPAQFLPKPGELLALARTTATPEGETYARLRKATDGPEAGDRPALTDADREAFRRLPGELAANVKPVEPAKAPPPSHGKADAGGLTPQMRAALARRHEGTAQ